MYIKRQGNKYKNKIKKYVLSNLQMLIFQRKV